MTNKEAITAVYENSSLVIKNLLGQLNDVEDQNGKGDIGLKLAYSFLEQAIIAKNGIDEFKEELTDDELINLQRVILISCNKAGLMLDEIKKSTGSKIITS